MTQRFTIHLGIELPDNGPDAAMLLAKVTAEIGGKYDLSATNISGLSHDVVLVDDEGNYDPADLAFFMLNNRIFSDEAENARRTVQPSTASGLRGLGPV